MHVESATAQPQVSLTTWCGLGALVLLLAGLSLFIIGCDLVFPLRDAPACPSGTVLTSDGICADRKPNYYGCECECTQGFSANARVSTAEAMNVRPGPAADPPLGQQGSGQTGTIVNGPVDAVLNGVNETWWEVNFDTGVDGWVTQSRLVLLSSDPLITKDLSVCLPAEFNANLSSPPFAHIPSPDEISQDCSTTRVAPAFAGLTGQQLPPGSSCTCQATTVPTEWVAECDAPCEDPSGVCLVAGSDPPEPTPAALSAALFATTSTCEVTGTAEVHIADEVKNTAVTGVMQIHGRPCPPGENCQVGISYQLKLADIEIPVRFHKNPKFVDLSVSGATEPAAVELTPFLTPQSPLYVGNIPTGGSLNSARGRKTGEKALVIVGRNGSPLDVAVDWVNKRCLINGGFVGGQGGVIDDDGNTVDLQLYLTAGGQTDALSRMVNQPPVANAGPDQIVECTSPAGAAVSLDAAGTPEAPRTTDADGNIAFYAWRRDADNGPYVTAPSPKAAAVTTQQAIGETKYFLRVVDGRLAADNDVVSVKVVDTSAPALECHAPVAISKHATPVAFKATAADTCGPAPAVVIASVDCFKVSPHGRVKDNPSCKVTIQGDTVTIDKTGGVDLIQWTTRATDAAGNVGQKTCEVRVD